MCDKVVKENPGLLWPVPDQYKTQEMCDKAVVEDLRLLEYVPDWFVTQQQIGLWGDDDDYCDDDLNLFNGMMDIKNARSRKPK